MAYEVILLQEAEEDIDEAVSWYEKQKINLGIRFYFESLENLEKLKFHPNTTVSYRTITGRLFLTTSLIK
jgi:hypothetical protein